MKRHTAPEDRYSRHAQSLEISRTDLAQAIARAGGNSDGAVIRKLSGGFQNANYLVETGGKKSVFRFYSAGGEAARREAGILEFLKGTEIAAPTLLDFFEFSGRHIAVLSFVEGELFQELLRHPAKVDPAVFRAVGRELGKTHGIELDRPGFLGPGMRIEGGFENFIDFARDYTERVLLELPEEKLSASLRDRTLAFVAERWHLVKETEPASSLVHCDFNPKNILISRDDGKSVAALLDWEFSLAGNGYIDLGNFFRFPHDYPSESEAEAEFQAGYEAGRGKKLHPRWREIGRLIDLSAMCSFLERKEEYPETFRTARSVIEATLAR